MILALLQGATEFLPVSSSGHLALMRAWLGLGMPGVTVELALHLGTLISVLLYYRQRLVELAISCVSGDGEGRRYALWIALASVPAILLYVLAGSAVISLFDRPAAVGGLLMLNGLWLTALRGMRPRVEKPLRGFVALLAGVAQACALLPGISRSGMTIATARRLGLNPARAAEFSLLMAIPLVAGGAALNLITSFRERPTEMWACLPTLLTGMAVSALVGWLAICVVVRVLSSGRFWMFGPYCLAAGGAALLFLR